MQVFFPSITRFPDPDSSHLLPSLRVLYTVTAPTVRSKSNTTVIKSMQRLSREENKYGAGHEQGVFKIQTVKIFWRRNIQSHTQIKWVLFFLGMCIYLSFILHRFQCLRS